MRLSTKLAPAPNAMAVSHKSPSPGHARGVEGNGDSEGCRWNRPATACPAAATQAAKASVARLQPYHRRNSDHSGNVAGYSRSPPSNSPGLKLLAEANSCTVLVATDEGS